MGIVRVEDGVLQIKGKELVWDGSGNGPAQADIVAQPANEPWLTALTATKYVVSYRGTSNVAQASVVDKSGTSLTGGGPKAGVSQGQTSTSITRSLALDSTRVLFAYKRNVDDSQRARVGTVSGTMITLGSESVIETGQGHNEASVALMDTDKVLMVYSRAFAGAGSRAGARILTISGTTITPQTAALNAANPSSFEHRLVKLDATKALWLYNDATTGFLRAVVLSVSGNVVTWGTPVTVKAATSRSLSAATINADNVFVAYVDSLDSNKGKAQVLTISGTTITTNTEYEFSSDQLATAIHKIDTTVVAPGVLLAYEDTSVNYNTRMATVVGTVITFQVEDTIVTGITPQIVTVPDALEVVTLYSDGIPNLDGLVLAPA